MIKNFTGKTQNQPNPEPEHINLALSSIHSFIQESTIYQEKNTPPNSTNNLLFSFSQTTNPRFISPSPSILWLQELLVLPPVKKWHKINTTNYGNFQHDQKEFVANIFKRSRRPHMTNHLFFWDVHSNAPHWIYGFSLIGEMGRYLPHNFWVLQLKGGKGVLITMNFAPHISSSVAGTAVILFFGFS